MIWNNMELLNVEEVEQREDGAILLRRFPRMVQEALGGEDGFFSRYVGRFTTGCELRFCGNGAAITLSGWEADGIVEVYRGDYFHSRHRVFHGQPVTIMLSKGASVDKYDVGGFKSRYSSRVWRVVFAHDFCAVVNRFEALLKTRPPIAGEIPEHRMMAYGSSITHGACATTFSSAYISIAARLLGVDILNKGMGGSCQCEREVADYLAASDWSIAILELGVNMLASFSDEEFEERAGYLVERAVGTKRPVVLISPYPNYKDLPDHEADIRNKQARFRDILRKIYHKNACDHLVYIRGEDVLDDFTGLTSDLIHPSDYGHSIMGRRLAERMMKEECIRKLLEK